MHYAVPSPCMMNLAPLAIGNHAAGLRLTEDASLGKFEAPKFELLSMKGLIRCRLV
jgi:hypothetical protein